MTSKDFCEAYSSFYGDKIDNLEQLKYAVFDGHELFEFAKYLIHRNNKKDKEVLLDKERGICIIGGQDVTRFVNLRIAADGELIKAILMECPDGVEVQPHDLGNRLKEQISLIEMQHYEDIDVEVDNQMLDPKLKHPRQPRVKQRAKPFVKKQAWRVHQRRG